MLVLSFLIPECDISLYLGLLLFPFSLFCNIQCIGHMSLLSNLFQAFLFSGVILLNFFLMESFFIVMSTRYKGTLLVQLKFVSSSM